MTDLRLDTDELSRTATALDQVSAVLSGTDRAADIAAAGVGHRALAAAVQDFADSSTRRRYEIAQATSQYAQAVRGVADTFSQVEESLAAAVTGEG